MGKFKFIKWLLLFLILSAVILFSVMNIPLAQNLSIKFFYIFLLILSFIFVVYIIFKIYGSLTEDIFTSPMKKAIVKHEELKKINPKAKFPLNKKQIALITLSFFALILYFLFGINLPAFHLINILIYIVIGLIIFLLGFIIIKPRYCPQCGTKLPRIRKPLDENEKLYGWVTCPNCKSQIDSHGDIVKKR